jgi:hypothetical protein
LWYKIAEANGLSGSQLLAAGTTLRIPAAVTNIHNNASTFQVHDINRAMGDLDPTAPKPQAAQQARHRNQCGMFGALFVTAFGVALSFILPPIAPALGPVVSGALTAATANVLTQGFAVATGIQDKFNWKGVALGALGGGVAGGLSNAIGGGTLLGSKLLTDAARGALGSAIAQGIGVATGLQDKFDWAGVATAGLGAAAGGVMSRSLLLKPGADGKLTGTPNAWNTPRGAGFLAAMTAADALSQATARSLVEGTSFGDNVLRALPSAIGNTIGNALGQALTAPKLAPKESRSPAYGETPAPEDVIATGQKELVPDVYFLADGEQPEFLLAGGRNPRARMGGNGGPPLLDPRTGQVLGVPVFNGPLGPVLAPFDSFLDITGPANRLQAGLLDRERQNILTELGRLDPTWRHPGSIRAPGPESLQAMLSDVTFLRTERAFMRYRRLGDTAPLAQETLRVYQDFVDQGYSQAMSLHQSGRLRIPRGWNLHQAVGSYTDSYARGRLRQWYGHHGVTEGPLRDVAVNRRLYNEAEGSYRIPDVRVGGVVFDATLSPKNINTPQVRGYLATPSTRSVVIVRPRAMGSYIITR